MRFSRQTELFLSLLVSVGCSSSGGGGQGNSDQGGTSGALGTAGSPSASGGPSGGFAVRLQVHPCAANSTTPDRQACCGQDPAGPATCNNGKWLCFGVAAPGCNGQRCF